MSCSLLAARRITPSALLAWLRAKPAVTNLSLRDTDWTDDADAEQLGHVVAESALLECLTLRHCPLPIQLFRGGAAPTAVSNSTGATTRKAQHKMLSGPMDARKVDLVHKDLGWMDAAVLAPLLLGKHLHIVDLNLKNNAINAKGAAAIAHVLTSNNSLTVLNLSENAIGAQGVASLCSALQENKKLEVLELGATNLVDQSRALSALQTLTANKGLRILGLQQNDFDEESQAELKARLVQREGQMIFHF